MKTARLVKISIAAALALSAASVAMGQQGASREERGWGSGIWDNSPWRGMHMGWRRGGGDWMLDRVEGRLAFMKAELKITEAQVPAWNLLAEAVRAAAKQHNERIKAVIDDDRLKTLPERLAAQEQLASARLDGIRQIRSSVESLYMVLSVDQRKEADDMVIPMVGMGRPWS